MGTIRDSLEEPVSEKAFANWIDELPKVPEKRNNKISFPAKMTNKSNKKLSKKRSIENRKKNVKMNVELKIGDIVRTIDLQTIFTEEILQKQDINFIPFVKFQMRQYPFNSWVFFSRYKAKRYRKGEP